MSPAIWTAPAAAQEERAVVTRECGPADETLRDFRVAVAGARGNVGCVYSKLMGTVSATADVIRTLVDGLERLARADDNGFVRSRAAGVLAGFLSDEERPEGLTTQRLLRLYRETEYEETRMGLLGDLGRATDNHLVLPLAAKIAVQPDGEEDFVGAAMMAIHALALMGEEGRAVLRRLQREGTVRSFHARAALYRMALYEFRSFPEIAADQVPQAEIARDLFSEDRTTRIRAIDRSYAFDPEEIGLDNVPFVAAGRAAAAPDIR